MEKKGGLETKQRQEVKSLWCKTEQEVVIAADAWLSSRPVYCCCR